MSLILYQHKLGCFEMIKNISLLSSVSFLSLTMAAGACDRHQEPALDDFEMSSEPVTVKRDLQFQIEGIFSKYFPATLARGKLAGLKTAVSTTLDGRTYSIPGAKSMDSDEANRFKGGSFPRSGVLACSYFAVQGVNPPEGCLFSELYLTNKALYVEEGNVIGLTASYSYWGCLSDDSNQYGWNEMPMVFTPLMDNDKAFFLKVL